MTHWRPELTGANKMATTTAKLNTGAAIPTVGLGLWKSGKGEVKRAVISALEHGTFNMLKTLPTLHSLLRARSGIAL